MNCREAQSQIFAEGNGAPGKTPRAALQGHVAQCAACRQIQDSLTVALSEWRAGSGRAIVPDAEREWQRVRRRIRGGAEVGDAPARVRRNIFAWLTLPLGVAAAIAVTLLVMQQRPSESLFSNTPELTARADAVEAPGNDASTMVFVDDKSGWVIVLASDSAPKRG